jgi:WD40 repeat protein
MMRKLSRCIFLLSLIISTSFVWKSSQVAVSGKDCNIKVRGFGQPFLFSPDDRLIVTTLDDQTVGTWLVSTGKLVRTFSLEWVSSVDISPDGRYLVAASQTGKVVLWDLKTGKQLQTFFHFKEGSGTLITEFSSNGKYLLTFPLYFAEAIIWNPLKGEKLYTIPKGGDPRDWHEFSPSGDYLLFNREW